MATIPFSERRNPVLAALERGDTPLGMQMFTHAPDLIEIVGFTGFDFVMIDTEHSRVDPETLVHCIRAAEASGAVPMVRVAENNPALIRAAVESGAQGIFVPHVMNAADAKRALEAMRYPPEGRCGICPSTRAARYSQDTWEEYMRYSNRNVMFVPLLEDVEAIEDAKAIVSLLEPGRDAVGLGFADIANSLLEPGERVQWQHPYLRQAFEKVKAITTEAGIPLVGMAWPEADAASAKRVMADGVRILIFFPDQHFWHQTCRSIIEAMRRP